MTDDLRRRAKQAVGDTPDLHSVIGHQPVSALQELDGRLTLADTGVAQNQHALAVDVHQHTVPCDLRRHGSVQIVDKLAGHVHGGLRGPQQRAVMLLCHLHQLRRDVHFPRHDEGRERIAQQLIEHPHPLRLRHAVQKAHFTASKDLQALIVKIVVKPHQLQGRTVHVRDGHNGVVEVAPLVKDLHAEDLHHFFQAGRRPSDFFHTGPSHSRRRQTRQMRQIVTLYYILYPPVSQHFRFSKKFRFFVK